MTASPRVSRVALFAVFFLLTASGRTHAQICFCDPCNSLRTQRESASPLEPNVCPPCNVFWQVADSIAGCPAADTLLFSHSPLHPHPARMRIWVSYEDNSCLPKVKVPPESIYVTYQIITGNLKVNDKGVRVYADDSTSGGGDTRITIPSFSGCGKVRVRLYVSNQFVGYRDRVVRTTDTNADGRTNSTDETGACDLNYNGTSGDTTDVRLVQNHAEHWRRNVLHGTLVRRTNLSYAEHTTNSYGASQVFWNPSGRWLSYTIHTSNQACNVFTVPSDPAIGDQPKQFTWLSDSSDYDPSWSPLNTEITFGRADYRILRKGIPGLNSDTTEKLVAASGDFSSHGDLTAAISPNGQWVAFARRDPATGDYHLWKTTITGYPPTQLTFTTGCGDQYPAWSPDGEWIIFDREIGYPNEHQSYKVKANQTVPGDTLTTVVYPSSPNVDAATPAYSPDGLIVTLGKGTHNGGVLDVRTYTIDPNLTSPPAILNYPDTAFAAIGPHPVLSPRISPDGTRLTLGSRQVWAARRNMNLPPVFTDIGGSVAETTSVVYKSTSVGTPITFTVTATDAEGDALFYKAYFLQYGMTFNEGTRTFSWTPGPISCGKTYYVKFRVATASGGVDVVIARIGVAICQGAPQSTVRPPEDGIKIDGPNPTRGPFVARTPAVKGQMAQLAIFDLSGRRVAVIHRPAGTPLVWYGTDQSDRPVHGGLYLYRVQLGRQHLQGKLVLVR